jgi:hypothetical protein
MEDPLLLSNLAETYEQPKVHIGQWRKNPFSLFDTLPFPIPNIVKIEQTEIVTRAKQILAEFGYTQTYFGFCSCKLCNFSEIHCSEFWISYNKTTYIIPYSYFHYLEEHNIRIDDRLVEIVEHYSNI